MSILLIKLDSKESYNTFQNPKISYNLVRDTASYLNDSRSKTSSPRKWYKTSCPFISKTSSMRSQAQPVQFNIKKGICPCWDNTTFKVNKGKNQHSFLRSLSTKQNEANNVFVANSFNKPEAGNFNQKITIKLKSFFKNYKYEKLENNYTNFNQQIFLSNLKSAIPFDFSLEKKLIGFANQNTRIAKRIHSPIVNTNKLPKAINFISQLALTTGVLLKSNKICPAFAESVQYYLQKKQRLNHNSAGFEVSPIEDLQKYKILKQQLKTSKKTKTFMSKNYFILNNPLIRKSVFYPNSITTKQRPSITNNYVICTSAEYFVSKLFIEGKKHRTYCFLQILLAKYLGGYNTKNKTCFGNLGVSSFIDYSIANTVSKGQYKIQMLFGIEGGHNYYQVFEDKSLTGNSIRQLALITGVQHFLFNKINNKTFLGYWLIPIAGFAFITPNLFYTLQTRSALQQKPQLIAHPSQISNLATLPQTCTGKRSTTLASVEYLKLTNTNETNWYKMSEKHPNYDFKEINNKYNNQNGQSLFIKKTLNNLFNFIKTQPFGSNFNLGASCYSRGCKTGTFNNTFCSSSTFLTTLSKNAKMTEPVEYYKFKKQMQETNKTFGIISKKQDINSYLFHQYKLLINKLLQQQKLIYTNTPVNLYKHPLTLTTLERVQLHIHFEKIISNFNTLKSILYLSKINPLNSKTFVNNNINFIKSKKLLKLLKMKILKLNKDYINKNTGSQLTSICVHSYLHDKLHSQNIIYKPQISDTSLHNKTLKISRSQIKDIQQKTFDSWNIRHKSVNSYKEGLNKINFYLKYNNLSCNKADKILFYKKFSKKYNKIHNLILKKQTNLKTLNKLSIDTNFYPNSLYSQVNTSTGGASVINWHTFLNNLENKNILVLNYINMEHCFFNDFIKQHSFFNGFIKQKLKQNLIKAIISNSRELKRNYSVKADEANNIIKAIQVEKTTYVDFNSQIQSSLPKQVSIGVTTLTKVKTLHICRKKLLELKTFLNELSVLFKHKKMFKNKTEVAKTRLHLQKKRKAKKQRLETRRQKKRTRFFPRPAWLRYRMILNFINQRKQKNKKMAQQIKWKDNKKKTVQTQVPVRAIQGSILSLRLDNRIKNRLLKKKAPMLFYSVVSKLKAKNFLQSKNYINNFTNNLGILEIMLSPSYDRQNQNIRLAAVYLTNYLKDKINSHKKQVYVVNRFPQKGEYKTKYIFIKNKTNYINFTNQKINNQLPQTEKEKNKDTMLRDFWIWAFNNTLTNNYGQKLFYWPHPNLGWAIRPQHTLITKNTKRITWAQIKTTLQINWALNKTNLFAYFAYNKRYNLWGTLKLRNQSKNNKTKFLKKEFIKKYNLFFLNKNFNILYKKIKSILNQKTQKLNSLLSLKFNNCLLRKQSKNISFSRNTSNTNNLILNTENVYIFNTSWWSNLNIKTLLSTLNSNSINFLITNNTCNNKNTCLSFGIDISRQLCSYQSNYVSHLPEQEGNLYSPLSLQVKINLGPDLTHHLSFKTKNISAFPFEGYTLIISLSLLLHLCTLISLASISQVRCFIKFHLILLYKLFNVYTLLINKISEFGQPSNWQNNSTFNQKSVYNLAILQKGNLKGQNFHENTSLSLYSSPQQLIRPNKIISAKSKIDNILEFRQNQNQLLTSFSIKLLKKQYKNFSKLDVSIPTTRDIRLFNNQEKNQKNKLNQPTHLIYSKLNIISFKSQNKLLVQPKSEAKPKIYNFNYKIKQTKLSYKKTINRLFKFSKNKLFFVIFTLIDLLQSAVRTISSFFEKPAEYTTGWIAFGFLVEWSSDLITIIPDNVDIYVWNIFSKVSRILPHNNFLATKSSLYKFMNIFLNMQSAQNFTKILFPSKSDFKRICSLEIKQNLIYNTNNRHSLPTDSMQNFPIEAFPILLMLSNIVHRRILHLFDILLQTMSQPDADLISRQEKGTLFWDIWADFLVTAADYYNVNVAALSTIKAEQNTLIENISNDFYQSQSLNFSKILSNKNISTQTEPVQNSTSIISIVQHKKHFGQKINKKTSLILLKKKNRVGLHARKEFILLKDLNMSKVDSVLTNLNRWSVNQYLTYQTWHNKNSNGDLFIDYHPPKSFSHIPVIKYNSLLQYKCLPLVCQIYSGIFNKHISKNVLLVNPKTTKQILTDSNVLLIQALAGETELKIITDNAQRYALVNRGFAIGIKLLRDVFDKIALNTPCIFLLENIDAIGERRPMLISDFGGSLADNNGTFKEDFFGSQRDEVHEKNIVVYQLTRHVITHYKKPFKGDYSLVIPTNLYLTTQKRLGYKSNTVSTDIYTQKNKHFYSENTSAFSILLLKEEKKLKPNKIVDELPWTGLPGEQLSTKYRASYSVRSKVALLAEMCLSSLSAKLDMITDLLVIIDSVRSNKGFVVFATTDVPYKLDPALRRPGRLDETICLPNISNNTNYEIIKSIHKLLGSSIQNKILNNLLTTKASVECKELHNILTVNLKDYNTVLQTKYFENSTLNFALISHANKKMRNLKAANHYEKTKFYGETFICQATTASAVFTSFQNTSKIDLQICRSVMYYEVGKVLLNYYLNNLKLHLSISTDNLSLANTKIRLKQKILSNKSITQLMHVFGGKIGQLLGSKHKFFIKKKLHLSDNKNNWYIKSDLNNILATEILLSFIHKCYLYRNNLIVPKLLSFTDGNVLEEPPSTPFSSLLIPAKHFENYKRVFHNLVVGERKAQISFIEKLQYNAQLRSIVRLKNTFVYQSFQTTGVRLMSNSNQNPKETKNFNITQQNYFFKKIGCLTTTVLDKNLLQSTTNFNWYYQNRILKRHSNYLTNQWWNGQLSEHNAETVFLSDIDWRSSFIKNKQKQIRVKTQTKNSSDSLDILLDFPDTNQYYNPQRRRWLLNKGYWNFWFNLDKVYTEEILSIWILESIIQTYAYLHNNTELLDFVTSNFIALGQKYCTSSVSKGDQMSVSINFDRATKFNNMTNFDLPKSEIGSYPKKHFKKSFSSFLNEKIAVVSSKTELSTVKEILLINSFKRFFSSF